MNHLIRNFSQFFSLNFLRLSVIYCLLCHRYFPRLPQAFNLSLMYVCILQPPRQLTKIITLDFLHIFRSHSLLHHNYIYCPFLHTAIFLKFRKHYRWGLSIHTKSRNNSLVHGMLLYMLPRNMLQAHIHVLKNKAHSIIASQFFPLTLHEYFCFRQFFSASQNVLNSHSSIFNQVFLLLVHKCYPIRSLGAGVGNLWSMNRLLPAG